MTDQPVALKNSGIRFITLLFAGLGLLTAAAIIFLAVTILSVSTRQRPAEEVKAQKGTETFRVESVESVQGQDLFAIIVAAANQDGGSISYTKSTRSIHQRNIILMNRSTGATRRIFPNNQHRMLGYRFLPSGEGATNFDDTSVTVVDHDSDYRSQKNAVALFYAVQISDVNEHDGLPPTRSLLIGTIATAKQGIVLSGVDGIEQMWMAKPNQLGLLVREKMRLIYHIIDIPTLKIVATRPVDVD